MSERSADILATLNERQRRLWAAAEARQIGRGGIAIVARATGLNKNTIIKGIVFSQIGVVVSSKRVA